MNTPDLSQILCKDRHFLKQAFKTPQRYGGEEIVQKKYEHSHNIFLKRQAKLPKSEFDDALPVNQKKEEIAQIIEKNQVTIVCGETGSGKTTQLPKICLALGRGTSGLIGHTQPRRLAARSVANRIADELHSPIGDVVGFKVRFTEQGSQDNLIKLMTDGILLAETQTDRYLNQYDTIIIDEAHERSLNIDFLLGFLKKILPRRPDLKVIITSATINAERFSTHFNNAPIIEVSGRTYPVQTLYRPLESKDEDDTEFDMEEAIVDAAFELSRMGSGDILVFLPGEREIRDTADALRKSHLKHYEILPLFARLSYEDQKKIFRTGGGRRIVLATNVAETSLTVPGIHYVIDTGLARVKRYSTRAKVEQLHIEKISQASAKQRSGRCGRVAAGVCIRLFSEEDFLSRSEFTDPEIMRTNLAAVILRMATLGLGEVKDFPFLNAPAAKQIADGYQVLHELGAVTERNELTSIGKELARLPIDPKIGRMLLGARTHHCVSEMLILVSALSIQDPRERPFESKEAANRAHEVFQNKESDFLSFLDLWDFFQKAREQKNSNRQLVQLCHQKFLSYLRLREWRDLYLQLKTIVEEMKFKLNEQPATPEQIHRALLTGLIGNIGMKAIDGYEYQGARGVHFHLFPGSGLFKGKPKWVMASELVETSRLYARVLAKIDPIWVEKEAPHLVKYHYFDPHWEKSRGEVVASERVTLYGLTVLPRRPVSYGRIAPEEARELFIRGALVEQDIQIRAAFFKHNQRLIKEVVELEHKSRKQDVLVDDEVLFQFYDSKIPADICTLAGFEKWRERIENKQPQLLFINKDELMQHAAIHITEEQFPKFWQTSEGSFPLTYRFEPKHPMDGVTLTIPLTILNQLNTEQLQWLVPGMIREKLTLLIKALPKQIRRNFVPVPDFITDFLSSQPCVTEPILPQLAKFMHKWQGVPLEINLHEWENSPLPDHCIMNIRVVDEGKQELAMGRNIALLQEQLGKAAQLTFRDNSQEFERTNITSWDIGSLPENIRFARGKQQLTGYLGLQLEKEGQVSLRLFDTEQMANDAHRQGVIALMKLHIKEQVKDLQKGIVGFTQIAMQLKNICNNELLLNDIAEAICDRAFIGDDNLPRDEKSFKEQISRARSRMPAVKQAASQILIQIATEYAVIALNVKKHPIGAIIQQRINMLLYPYFVRQTPWSQLAHLPRYLKALGLRMDKYASSAARDKQRTTDIDVLIGMWEMKIKQNDARPEIVAQLKLIRWVIEELNVSLFAQELKTPYPVSIKRITKQIEEISKI